MAVRAASSAAARASRLAPDAHRYRTSRGWRRTAAPSPPDGGASAAREVRWLARRCSPARWATSPAPSTTAPRAPGSLSPAPSRGRPGGGGARGPPRQRGGPPRGIVAAGAVGGARAPVPGGPLVLGGGGGEAPPVLGRAGHHERGLPGLAELAGAVPVPGQLGGGV